MLFIENGYIKTKKKPSNLFLQFLPFRKIAKVKDIELCKKMVKAYNENYH